MKKFLAFAVIASSLLMFAHGADSDAPPRVTATSPRNGAQDVDPATAEIWVKFDRTMTDGSWSWCYEDRSRFPLVGTPRYVEDVTKCVLPVKLEPGKEYVVWINTANSKNFKDRAGRPAAPYRFTFRTK